MFRVEDVDPDTLELVKLPDSRLYEPCTREIGVEDIDFAELEIARALADLMAETGGIGFAAPQAGVPMRLFVWSRNQRPVGPDWRDKDQVEFVFNPRILSTGKSRPSMREECLSVADQVFEVERWEIIEVEYYNGDSPVRRTLKRFAARVFQHEFDHLSGVLVSDRGKKIVNLKDLGKGKEKVSNG